MSMDAAAQEFVRLCLALHKSPEEVMGMPGPHFALLSAGLKWSRGEKHGDRDG